eukprot:gene20193-687_t
MRPPFVAPLFFLIAAAAQPPHSPTTPLPQPPPPPPSPPPSPPPQPRRVGGVRFPPPPQKSQEQSMPDTIYVIIGCIAGTIVLVGLGAAYVVCRTGHQRRKVYSDVPGAAGDVAATSPDPAATGANNGGKYDDEVKASVRAFLTEGVARLPEPPSHGDGGEWMDMYDALLKKQRRRLLIKSAAAGDLIDDEMFSAMDLSIVFWTAGGLVDKDGVSKTGTFGGCRRELCWLINYAIRTDDPELLAPLFPCIRALNSF